MKYTPKELTENVNVSKTSPIGEFALLSIGIIGVLIAAYIGLGFLVGIAAEHMPLDYEAALGKKLFKTEKFEPSSDPRAQYLQKIVDRLVANLPKPKLKFQAHVMNVEMINAFAHIGGHIVVTEGLLKKAKSENELAFVLGHEIGHFVHRDHLKGLGRGLVLFFMVALATGPESQAAEFCVDTVLAVQAKFSQLQETSADLVGLELLNITYGHVGGATDFFGKIQDNDPKNVFAKIYGTHPISQSRINFINKVIAERSYKVKPTVALKF